ncbi:ankyrin repeat family protein [Tanacetum coccineum]
MPLPVQLFKCKESYGGLRREHKKLRKDREEWMKNTADSYTITVALIITIVFAAAITVLGGNDDKTGKPIFETKPSFIIFVVADAISLFTATTSLGEPRRVPGVHGNLMDFGRVIGGSGGTLEGRFGEHCGGNGGIGGSMFRVGEGKDESMGGMGSVTCVLCPEVGAGGGEDNDGGVDLGVSKRLSLLLVGDTCGIEVWEVGVVGGGPDT